MASDYIQIEKKIKDQLCLPVPSDVFNEIGLFDHLYEFADHIATPVDYWVRDSGINDRDRGVVNTMNDGLRIAIYGFGQVIRQSEEPARLGRAARLFRLQSGAGLLRSIADLGLDKAVSLE